METQNDDTQREQHPLSWTLLIVLVLGGSVALLGCNSDPGDGNDKFDDSETIDSPEEDHDDDDQSGSSGDEEPNDTISSAEDLGTLDELLEFQNAAISSSNDQDYFSFELPQMGDLNSRAQILFNDVQGDLDLELLDSSGLVLESAISVTNNETISLNGLSPGTYYIRVYGFAGATNTYDVRIEPPA